MRDQKEYKGWVAISEQRRCPMFEGFYFVELEVYPLGDRRLRSRKEITILEYKLDEGFNDGWVFPTKNANEKAVVKAYKLPKIAIPTRNTRKEKESV